MDIIDGLVEGIKILEKYGYVDISAEHDIIYATPKWNLLSDDDKLSLEKLGWCDNNGYTSFYV